MKTKQRKLGRKLLSFLLTLTMLVGLIPGLSLTAYAATTLTAETTTWENGDYVVPTGGVTISGHITVNGTVNLTLTTGTTLTANAGITLSDGATLNVSGEGAMVVNGSNGNANSTIAGTGKLVLKSGTLTAQGGTGQGIGDRTLSDITGANGGTAINGSVIVNGGTMTATGGNGGSLGSQCAHCKGGNGGAAIGGSVTINAGTVTATGGNGGTIGSRCSKTSTSGAGGVGIDGSVTINGGKLTTTNGTGGGTQNGGNRGAGGNGYDGTLTLGKGVKLYEGTDDTGTVLDGNDSASRVYEGDKKTSMYAYGPDFYQVTDKTALNNAITAAETLYNSIKDNNDYSTIANTLYAAIDTAKDVAYSDEADQDAIDAATTAITTAKTNAEAAKKDVDDTTEANKVSDLIEDLPAKEAITKNDKIKVDAAKAAYDYLTDDQKKKVSEENKQKLNDAVAAIAAIEKEEADTTAAKAVSDKISELPSKDAVKKDDKTAIDAAKAAYDALTDDQKKKVSDEDKQKLNAAVAAIEAIEKDEAAAKAVSDKISELPSKEAVTKNDKTAIDAAKAAYDELTDDQKKKVSDADKQKLNDAVAAIEAIEKDKADAETVQAVSDKIAALPAKDAVTKDDKDAINAAKEAFDALTDDQKKKVSEADRQKLDDAVAALAAIDGEGNTPTPTPVPGANVSGNDTVSIKKLELSVKGAQTLSVGEEATIKAAVTGKGSDASLNSVNWVAPSGHVVVTEVQADGSLKVKAVGPGTAFVTAVCGGKAKTVKYTVKQPVNRAEASLNAITLSVKEKYRICVNLDAPTTDKFFYATNDKKVCAVNGKGIIAAKGVGTTTVDILAGEKKNTAKKVASITVTVKEGAAAAVEVKDVSINYVGNKTLYTGEMAYISTLVNGGANNGGQAVKYSFSNKGIVKIDAYGHLTAQKAGKVTVTASCGGKEASVELTVQQPLKTLKVNKTYVKVKQGKAKTVTLSVKTSPALNKSDIKAVWSVANEGNGVKKISDENGKAVFEVSAATKDTVVTATVTDPVTGRTYTVNSVIDVN